MTDLYGRLLKWRVEEPYQLLNGRVSSRWDWGGGRSAHEVVRELRSALASDPRLRVLVTHGASDLVTPYFENQLIIAQIPAVRFARAAQAVGLRRRAHVLFARCLAPRAARGRKGALSRRRADAARLTRL